jgi:hypothetical protein
MKIGSNLKIVLILVLVIVVLCVAGSISLRAGTRSVGGAPYQPRTAAVDLLSTIDGGLDLVTCSKDKYGYAIVGGTLKNRTSETLVFVQVKVMLKDGGSVVDTDSTYAVGGEGLAPGESTTWEWMFNDAPTFDQCSAEVFEYKTR